jgi:hypothetical protein
VRLFTLLLLASGCGSPFQIAQVEGTVKRNGKALPGVLVQFLPDPSRDTTGPTAMGETDDTGRFRLRYIDNHRALTLDGAVVGWHLVTVADARQTPAPQGQPPRPSRVPDAYSNLATTPLRQEVHAGTQQIDLTVD